MNAAVTPAASHIKIDGRLDEQAWQKAAMLELPYEWQPGDAIPAPVKTEVLITYDHAKIYIAFRCFDPEPQKIRAHVMGRDSIDTFIMDDHVSFMLDTFNDERRAFQFRVNPLGVQADANFSELEGYEDFSWDAIWASAGRITDFGYTVEVAIPFNQLRFAKGGMAQTWGFEADRSWPRNVRHRMSTHVRDRDRNCLICQFNKLSGFQGISPGKNLEFDPTLTAAAQRRQGHGNVPRRRPGKRQGQGRSWHQRPLGRHAQPDAQRRGQPRFLAGRGRRGPARRQHPLRPALPGKAPFLPRGRRLFPDPPGNGLHAHAWPIRSGAAR